MTFFEVRAFADIYGKLEQSAEDGPAWQARFAQSPLHQQYVTERLRALETMPPTPPQPEQAGAAPIGWWRQFQLLLGRYAELVLQDRTNLLLALASALLIGIIISLVGGVWVFADGTPVLDAQRVIFLLALAAVFLGANTSAQEIVKEIPIYLRERLVGLRIVPYVLSKFVVLAVLSLAQSVLLVLFALWSTGLPPNGALLGSLGLVELIIGVWLTTLGGVGMGLLISAWAPNTDIATSVVPMLLVFQIMLAGLIFPLNDCIVFVDEPRVAVCSDVLSYPIVARWATDSLGTTAELNRLFYQDFVNAPPGIRPLLLPSALPTFEGANYGRGDLSGAQEFTAATLAHERRLHLLGRWGILLVLTALFLTLACVVLRWKDRRWQTR
jgi:fumarate reductase subunit C